MNIDAELPSTNEVEFLKDDQHGDAFHYRLRLRFTDESMTPPREEQMVFPWTITGSEIAVAEIAGGSHAQLEEEKLDRYREAFVRRVRAEMRRSKTVLTRERGRLVRRHTNKD